MHLLRNFKLFIRLFGKYRWHIVTLTVLGFLSAILEGVGINIAIPLFSFLVNGGNAPTDLVSKAVGVFFSFLHVPFTFRYLLGFILGLFLLRSVSLVAFGYIRGLIVADYLTDESTRMLSRTLTASWPFLAKQKLGNLHNTLTRDIQRASDLLGSLSQLIQSASGFLIYAIVAFNISAVITTYTFIAGFILLFIARPFLRRGRAMGETLATTEKEMSQFLSEHIIGIKSIKAASAEREAFTSGKTILGALKKIYTRITLVRSLSTSFFQPFSLLFVVILFLITYKSGTFNFLAFAASFYLIQKIFTYLESAQASLHSVTELIPYAENLVSFRTVMEEHTEEPVPGTKPLVFKKTLAFNDVSFSYETGNKVLDHLNFKVNRGETIGLIGPSGAGKSSIADLILRLLEPTSGSILLDEVPLTQISLTEWRKQLGYVSQDVFLFNGTIEDNIRFYRSTITKDEIIQATKEANIYDFIQTLDDGFATHVGDRGVLLSGGQRQRIALARALAGKPSLLILDEATSALDTFSERLVQEAIEALHGTVTVIAIAHRLSTIERADRILVLDKGGILEEGSPAELARDVKSYYSRHRNGG